MQRRSNNTPIKRFKADKHYLHVILCDEWLNDFEVFKNWALQSGYSDNLTIDRIDGTKGYSPDNCRWATLTTQAQNTKIQHNNTSGYRGISYDKSRNKWVARIQISNKTHQKRCDTLEEAVNLRNKWITEIEGHVHKIQKYKG